MGTRNLTIVKMDGEIKVRQYCQWDGYPTGVGKDLASFIQNKMDLRKLKSRIKATRFVKGKEVSERMSKILGHDKPFITFEESDKLKKAMPEFHRDTGPKILDLIQSGKASEVSDGGPFTPKSWCEYAYVIDLDAKTVTVRYGFGKNDKREYTFKQFTPAAMEKLEKELAAKWNE